MVVINVVLVSPKIPSNVGNVGRTCLAYNATLHIVDTKIKLDDKSVKRAGLDYWKDVKVKVYDSWDEFKQINTQISHKYFFSSKGKDLRLYSLRLPTQGTSKNEMYEGALIFGSETEGLYEMIGEKEMEGHHVLRIPMLPNTTRCLNLSNSCCLGIWEYWKQNQPEPFY